MKRLLCLAALSVLALSILAPAALAQPGGARTCEDFSDQGGAQEAFDIGVRTGDLGADRDVLDEDGDGIACEELPPDPNPNRPATGATPGPSAATCEDFTDQGEAQEFYNRVVRGDPALLAVDPNALDEDADGIACEELPTVTDPNRPAPGTKTGEEEVKTGEGADGENTRRERRERTGGEETGGSAQEQADNGGETPGSDEGGSGGGNGSADSDKGGASQGGVSGAVSDSLGSIGRGRLPNTGGGWAVLLLAGAALIGGGFLLVRRFSSSA